MKIKCDADGKIMAVGIDSEIDGAVCPDVLPADFMNTFALGKYKTQKNTDGAITIVEAPGWVMPEKTVYTVDEIERMSKDQLLTLQAKLQGIINKADQTVQTVQTV